MDDRTRRKSETAWAALQVDDLAVLLQTWSFGEIADQFEKARNTLESAAARLENAA